MALAARMLRRYARRQVADIEEFVVGSRVLDIGSAEAYVPAALSARSPGVWACAVDIGGYRRAPTPYAVYDGYRLPFRDAAFDTTLLLLTLHHCELAETILDEAIRVTRHRLIVTESVYRTRMERWWLALLDGRVNSFRHGGAMRPATHVRPPEEWQRLFQARGLSIFATRWLGSAIERLVHHPLLWVLDVTESRTGHVAQEGHVRAERAGVTEGDHGGARAEAATDRRMVDVLRPSSGK